MKSVLFMVGAVVVILFYCFETDIVNAEGVKEKSCKQIISGLTKRQLGGISTCTKSMKFKNGKDKSKKMNCILKCVLEKEGVLPADGNLSQEHVDSLLIREFPGSIMDKANQSMTPCVELARGKLDSNPTTDEFCMTYDPFIKCLLGALPNLCS